MENMMCWDAKALKIQNHNFPKTQLLHTNFIRYISCNMSKLNLCFMRLAAPTMEYMSTAENASEMKCQKNSGREKL